ncbi:hypothetical protein PG993_007954 [Apiospora rasikravindrae]|uniref:Uncharacterized protein n=1 Tax=Apiospora rasikravindrae TaxID=990691 RepID=A0ABR1T194_9PEZI
MSAMPVPFKPSSPLFLLPSELRHRIWEYYLAFTHADFTDSMRPMHTFLDNDAAAATNEDANVAKPSSDAPPHAAPLPSLMLASKSAYRELAPLVHTAAVLRVRRPGSRNERRVGFAAHGNLRFERLRRLVLVVDLDYPYWNAWLDFFGAVLARAPGLEHVAVDWAPRRAASAASSSFLRDGGWESRRDKRKEDAFLDMLVGSAGLQSIRFYGTIPEHWAETIQQGTSVAVKCYPFRWWREPGMD